MLTNSRKKIYWCHLIFEIYLKMLSSFPDEAQEAEAIQVINAILDLREQQSVQTPAVMCKIYFTTAMLQFILGDMPKVSSHSWRKVLFFYVQNVML